MKKSIACLLVCLFILSFCSQVLAKPNVDFLVTNVYWVNTNRLAVEGYFKNNDAKALFGLNYFDLVIYYQNKSDGKFYFLTAGIWENGNPYSDETALNLNAFSSEIPISEAYIYPGQTSSWKFILTTEETPNFDKYKYDWYAQYDFID